MKLRIFAALLNGNGEFKLKLPLPSCARVLSALPAKRPAESISNSLTKSGGAGGR
jgi:hypothetical protein